MLEIKDLTATYNDKTLLAGINIDVPAGARYLVAGHNGSGKSTLAGVIAGAPEFNITRGKIIFDGHDITHENATTRALLGIFLGAQNVPEIPGLTTLSFLKHSMAAHYRFQTGRELAMGDFLTRMEKAREKLNIPKEWLNRGVNVGFSGGERKRLMLMRLIMTQPKLAILDEPDSGADATTQQQIADVIHEMPDTTFMFISHQEKFTQMVAPTHRVILAHGQIKTTD